MLSPEIRRDLHMTKVLGKVFDAVHQADNEFIIGVVYSATARFTQSAAVLNLNTVSRTAMIHDIDTHVF